MKVNIINGFHELIDERNSELREAFDMIADENTKTIKIEDTLDIIGDICMILALDLKNPEKFFNKEGELIPIDINKEKLNFDDFLKLLEIYLKETYCFGEKISQEFISKVEYEIKKIFDTYFITFELNNQIIIPLEQFDEFRQFFIEKSRNQPYIKNSRPLAQDFEAIMLYSINLHKTEGVDDTDSFRKFMIYLKINQRGITKYDFIYMLKKLNVLTIPAPKNLFKKVDENLTSKNQETMNRFFKRYYRKAVELFDQCSDIRYNCYEQTITRDQVFEYLEDLFRDELIIKDEGEELFINTPNNCMKVKIYQDVYFYDFLRIDKTFYEEHKSFEPYLSYEQVIDFLEFFILYTETINISLIYKFEDGEKKEGQFGDALIDSYRNSIAKYTEMLNNTITEDERNNIKKIQIFFHKEQINLKKMPESSTFRIDSLQDNLRNIFKYYNKHDPMLTSDPKKHQARDRSGTISQEAFIHFCLSFQIIEKFTTKNKVELILENFPSYLNYSDFLKLLRCIAYDLYSHETNLSKTQKLQKLFMALKLESPQNVANFSYNNDSHLAARNQYLKLEKSNMVNDNYNDSSVHDKSPRSYNSISTSDLNKQTHNRQKKEISLTKNINNSMPLLPSIYKSNVSKDFKSSYNQHLNKLNTISSQFSNNINTSNSRSRLFNRDRPEASKLSEQNIQPKKNSYASKYMKQQKLQESKAFHVSRPYSKNIRQKRPKSRIVSNIDTAMRKDEDFMNKAIFGGDVKSMFGPLTDVDNLRLKVHGGGRRIFSYGAKLTEDKSRAAFKWM